jgi:hypothetical protein
MRCHRGVLFLLLCWASMAWAAPWTLADAGTPEGGAKPSPRRDSAGPRGSLDGVMESAAHSLPTEADPGDAVGILAAMDATPSRIRWLTREWTTLDADHRLQLYSAPSSTLTAVLERNAGIVLSVLLAMVALVGGRGVGRDPATGAAEAGRQVQTPLPSTSLA